MMKDYSDECLYKDVYTIINMMDENMRGKIDSKFIDFLRENQDEEYVSCINPNIPLKEQEINEDIKIFLSMIYINYLCSEEEKAQIMLEEKENINKEKEKYSYENIFKNQAKPEETKVEENVDKLNDENITGPKELVVVKKKNIIQRIFEKILSFFK